MRNPLTIPADVPVLQRRTFRKAIQEHYAIYSREQWLQSHARTGKYEPHQGKQECERRIRTGKAGFAALLEWCKESTLAGFESATQKGEA